MYKYNLMMININMLLPDVKGRDRVAEQVQLPLPQRDPIQSTVLHLRLVVQRRLLTGNYNNYTNHHV
jgi:hypothetical protein